MEIKMQVSKTLLIIAFLFNSVPLLGMLRRQLAIPSGHSSLANRLPLMTATKLQTIPTHSQKLFSFTGLQTRFKNLLPRYFRTEPITKSSNSLLGMPNKTELLPYRSKPVMHRQWYHREILKKEPISFKTSLRNPLLVSAAALAIFEIADEDEWERIKKTQQMTEDELFVDTCRRINGFFQLEKSILQGEDQENCREKIIKNFNELITFAHGCKLIETFIQTNPVESDLFIEATKANFSLLVKRHAGCDLIKTIIKKDPHCSQNFSRLIIEHFDELTEWYEDCKVIILFVEHADSVGDFLEEISESLMATGSFNSLIILERLLKNPANFKKVEPHLSPFLHYLDNNFERLLSKRYGLSIIELFCEKLSWRFEKSQNVDHPNMHLYEFFINALDRRGSSQKLIHLDSLENYSNNSHI